MESVIFFFVFLVLVVYVISEDRHSTLKSTVFFIVYIYLVDFFIIFDILQWSLLYKLEV